MFTLPLTTGGWVRGRRRHFRPRLRGNNAHSPRTGEAGLPREGTPRRASPGAAWGTLCSPLLSSPHPEERSRVLPSGPPFPAGGVGSPPPCGAPRVGLALSPGGGSGDRAAAAGSPLIVRGGGGGGGGAPEPRQDVAEAVVAVQLGLAL
ncbi:hypothetical protein P7K49_001648, partial [Saguinus oedipus]